MDSFIIGYNIGLITAAVVIYLIIFFCKEKNKGGTTMTIEEYIQWSKKSIKELSKSIGIPKSFLEKHKEEQQ